MSCPNCGHRGSHFIPPSFGEPGLFVCSYFCEECRLEADEREAKERAQLLEDIGDNYGSGDE